MSQQQIEAYFARYGTNAETLLAAAQVADGRAYYLRIAATNFPNDPAVQFYIANLNVFPGQKREWLDRLKESAPDNAMADYLSAADYLRGGNKEAALKDFEAAANKAGFSDYSLDSAQRAEEILLASGKSPGEAKALGMEGTLLPALAGMKELSRGMADIMKDYATAGETETANNLAEMNYRLGQRLSSGEGGKFLIHQLVGFAVERITLSQLDPAGSYQFLGNQTPAERIEELQAERVRIRNLTAAFPDPQDASQYNDPDWISYFDRTKIYGERSAMEWLQKRRGTQKAEGPR